MDDNQDHPGLENVRRRSLLRFGGAALTGIAGAGLASVLPIAAPPAFAADLPVGDTLRMVVTSNNAQGRSYILKDERIKRGPRPLIWSHNALETMGPGGPSDPKTTLPSSMSSIDPPVGAAEWRFATIGPSKKKKGEPLERVAGKDGFHRTATIDYNVFLNGEMHLFVEEGDPVVLHAGDVVIQRNTSHAWLNYTDQPIMFLSMLVRV